MKKRLLWEGTACNEEGNPCPHFHTFFAFKDGTDIIYKIVWCKLIAKHCLNPTRKIHPDCPLPDAE